MLYYSLILGVIIITTVKFFDKRSTARKISIAFRNYILNDENKLKIVNDQLSENRYFELPDHITAKNTVRLSYRR